MNFLIINLANKKNSIYKIAKKTGISKGKIRRCLNKCKIETIKQKLIRPWEESVYIKIKYNFNIWKTKRDDSKASWAYNYAKEAETIYLQFIMFCKNLYENKTILGKKVKRSVDEFIKEFRKKYPNGDIPSRSWTYKMAKNENYLFECKWLPHTKIKRFRFKSEHEQLKAVKYNSIEIRPKKELLRKEKGNFEIDSFIGKRNDKQALLTLIDIATGDFHSRFYDRTMYGFKKSLEELIKIHNLKIKTLTMDNGGENNLIGTIIENSKLFNCHPYNSGEKGTLENKHRILRRIFKKSESLNCFNNNDLISVNQFVNNYYSKTFNRI